MAEASAGTAVKMEREVAWEGVFDEAFPCPGASEEDRRHLASVLFAPLMPSERRTLRRLQKCIAGRYDPYLGAWPRFDPQEWTLPPGPLPRSYLSFLAWSNGGEFRRGERRFRFYAAGELRECLLGYQIPQYLPGAVPFASDGSRGLYLFDMRRPAREGEYPVLYTGVGVLEYESACRVAFSFLEACRGGTDPAEGRDCGPYALSLAW